MFLITADELCKKLRISKATFWKLTKENGFPSPFKPLGDTSRKHLWIESQIDDWILKQVEDNK